MQVVEVNASFIGMMISAFAIIGCIVTGIMLGISFRKRLEELKRRYEIRLKSAHDLTDYEIRKAEAKGFDNGFEVGYQQALADVKTGKVKTGIVKGGDYK